MNIPIPENEQQRLIVLDSYDVTQSEAPLEALESITQLAADLCGVTQAYVSFIDADTQWLKARINLDAEKIDRRTTFCSHTISQQEPLIVPDTLKDKRFADNLFVVQAPHLRFYAGIPLIIEGEFAIGTLCVVGTEPHELNAMQMRGLKTLADQIIAQLELRKQTKTLEAQVASKTAELSRQTKALEIALTSADVGVWEWDIPNNHVTWTDNTADVLRVDHESFDGTFAGYQAIIHPDDSAMVNSAIEKTLQEDQPYDLEHRIQTENGEVQWMQCRGVVIRNDEGLPVRMLGTVANITNQTAATEAIQQREQLYQQVLDAIPDMVLVKKDKSAIYWANKAFRDYYGMSNEALQDMIDAPFNEPDYTLQYVKDDEHVFSTGEILDIPNELVTRHDGVVQSFHTIKAPIFDETGNVFLTVGVSRDLNREARLREQLYQQVLDAIPDMVLVKKDKSAIYWANKAFRDYYGMSNEALQDMIDAPFNEPDYTLQYVKDDEHVFSTGEILDIPNELVTRHDGVVQSFHTIKAPIFDETGNVFLTVGVSRDLTEQMAQQALLAKGTTELEQNRRFLNTIIDAIPSSIFWKDRNGAYIGSNQQFALDTGLTKEALIGKTDHDLTWSEEETAFFHEIDQRVIEQNKPELNILQSQSLANGKEVWVETNIIPLNDGEGQVVGVLGTYQDVTKRVESQQALQVRTAEIEQSQAFLQLIINNIPSSIFWKDRNSHFLGANQHFSSLLGLTPEDLIGKSELDLPIPKEEAHRFIETDQRIMQSNQAELGVLEQQQNHEGVMIWQEVNRLPIHNEQGEVFGILGTIQDVTKRIQSDLVLQKRAAELEILTDLSRAVALANRMETFLPGAVNFIKERFNLYHAHIYLLNPAETKLVLHVGAGEVGRHLVEQGHQIPLEDEASLVARTVRTRKAIIENDLRAAPTFLPNPLLPESKASMVIPLIAGDRALGALNTQAAQTNHFTEEDIRIQTTLAEQIALAIQNERNAQQTESVLNELRNLTQRLTADGWDEYIAHTPDSSMLEYSYHESQIEAMPTQLTLEENDISQYIEVYGEEIGVLEFGADQLNDNTEEIIEAVTERLGQHLDNLRLAEQAQQRTKELLIINRIAQAVSRLLSREQLLDLIFKEITKIYDDFYAFTVSVVRPDNMLEMLMIYEGGHFVTDNEIVPLEKSYYSKQIIETRKPLLIQSDEQKEEKVSPDSIDTKSCLFLPVFIGENAYILSMQSETYGRYSDSDLPLLTGITTYIGIGLENATLFEETRKRAERERLVNEITRKIQGTVTLKNALETAVQELGQVFQAKHTEIEITS